jgi:hypothetical protein
MGMLTFLYIHTKSKGDVTMKANDILWDVRFPRELRDFPRAVNIPPEKDAAAYLTCLTGIRPKGFRLVSSETDATACPQSATALPRYINMFEAVIESSHG